MLSSNNPLPNNAIASRRGSALVNNRFSRSYNTAETDLRAVEDYRRRTQRWESVQLKMDPTDMDNDDDDNNNNNDTERDAVLAAFASPEKERKTTLQWDGEGRSERKTALQWDSPNYSSALRRSRISKAFMKDEEEGAGLGQESPRPKTGWV